MLKVIVLALPLAVLSALPAPAAGAKADFTVSVTIVPLATNGAGAAGQTTLVQTERAPVLSPVPSPRSSYDLPETGS